MREGEEKKKEGETKTRGQRKIKREKERKRKKCLNIITHLRPDTDLSFQSS